MEKLKARTIGYNKKEGKQAKEPTASKVEADQQPVISEPIPSAKEPIKTVPSRIDLPEDIHNILVIASFKAGYIRSRGVKNFIQDKLTAWAKEYQEAESKQAN